MAQVIIRDLVESPEVETIGAAGDGCDSMSGVVSRLGKDNATPVKADARYTSGSPRRRIEGRIVRYCFSVLVRW